LIKSNISKEAIMSQKRKILFILLCIIFLSSALFFGDTQEEKEIMTLPKPSLKGDVSVEEAINSRRSTRSFKPDPLSISQLSQLLWAAQGITITIEEKNRSFRSAPSAGALYPIYVYVIVGEKGVTDLTKGIYKYNPEKHTLLKISGEDKRLAVAQASYNQSWMDKAPVILMITAEYERSMKKYGERGVRYSKIESGCVAQDIFLQAEALGLGVGIVGAFHDYKVMNILKVWGKPQPLLAMPVGYKK
jgi:SagB-type dehydrogenase family enzyme